MEQALFIPFLIWIFLTFILSLNKSLPSFSKIIIIFILGFCLFFWKTDLLSSFITLTHATPEYLLILLYQSLHLAIFSLFWLWPFSLILILSSSDNKTRNLILTVSILFSLIAIFGYITLSWISFSNIK